MSKKPCTRRPGTIRDAVSRLLGALDRCISAADEARAARDELAAAQAASDRAAAPPEARHAK
ncbi:MAG TPA: hypothetical protein VND64_07810 [Pirellulales bacterium]|nr:hypothetical protein [Pirellulales bacterium]